LTTIAVIALRV